MGLQPLEVSGTLSGAAAAALPALSGADLVEATAVGSDLHAQAKSFALEDQPQAVRNKLVMREKRFKYPRTLNRLKDMGFPDNDVVKQVIMEHEGDIGATLQYLTQQQ